LPGLAVVAAVGLGWWSAPGTEVAVPEAAVAPSAQGARPAVVRTEALPEAPAAPAGARLRRPTERGVVPMLAPIVGWPSVSVEPMADADPGLDWDAVDWSDQGGTVVDASWY
jgi:hypothetical protein